MPFITKPLRIFFIKLESLMSSNVTIKKKCSKYKRNRIYWNLLMMKYIGNSLISPENEIFCSTCKIGNEIKDILKEANGILSLIFSGINSNPLLPQNANNLSSLLEEEYYKLVLKSLDFSIALLRMNVRKTMIKKNQKFFVAIFILFL